MKMQNIFLLIFPLLIFSCSKENVTTESSNVRTVTLKSTLAPEITPMSNQRQSMDPSSQYYTWGYKVRLVDSEGNEYVVNDYSLNDELSFDNVIGEATISVYIDFTAIVEGSYYLYSDLTTISANASSVSVEMYNKDWAFVEVWGETNNLNSVTISPEEGIYEEARGDNYSLYKNNDLYYAFINTARNETPNWTLTIKSPEGITTTSFDAEADQSYSFQLLPSETDSIGNSLEINMDINPGFQSESHDFVIEGPSKKEQKLGVIYSEYNGYDYEYDTVWLQKEGSLYVLDADSLYTNDNTNRYYSIIDFENDKSYRQISSNNKFNSHGDYSRSVGNRSFYLPENTKLYLNEKELTFWLDLPYLNSLYIVGNVNDWDTDSSLELTIANNGNLEIEIYFNKGDEFKFIRQRGSWDSLMGYNSSFSFLYNESNAANFVIQEEGDYTVSVNPTNWEYSIIKAD